MNELQFGNKIRQVLNQGAQLDEKSLARLRAAREIALKHQRVAEPARGLAWAGSLIGGFGGLGEFSLRLILPMAVLVGGLLAINGWQQNLRVAEVAEIDSLLLTDDLPLDAFLDKGFETWLKKRAPH
jgi:hypothetical protein